MVYIKTLNYCTSDSIIHRFGHPHKVLESSSCAHIHRQQEMKYSSSAVLFSITSQPVFQAITVTSRLNYIWQCQNPLLNQFPTEVTWEGSEDGPRAWLLYPHGRPG